MSAAQPSASSNSATAVPANSQAGPRLALVLGAGGARGLAHIGALKVLSGYRLPIDLVVGSSMGSLIGGAYAAGLDMNQVERLVMTVRAGQLLRLRPTRDRMVDASGLARVLRNAFEDRTFADLAVPFAAVATSLRNGRLVVLRQGPLVPALLAAITMPLVFPPVRLGDDLLVDGGVTDGLPVSTAWSLGARRVLAIDADIHGVQPLRSRLVRSRVSAMRDWLLRCPTDRVSRRLVLGRWLECILADRLPERAADVVIRPDFGRLSSNHFHRRAHCIALGEAAARKALPEVLRVAAEANAPVRGTEIAHRSPRGGGVWQPQFKS